MTAQEDVRLLCGDSRALMATLEPESVDSIVTDPPYGLSFMGKGWDHGVPGSEFWTEALRVAKPGAHLLAFGGTRTFHRLAVAIEDAGWEIRDCVMWVYGSGFPKSLDVSKAIDKAAGAEREVIGSRKKRGLGGSETFAQDAWTQAQRGVIDLDITAPATDAAKQWAGWGTALKPAWEPVIVARKPLVGTVAANLLKHGTGAINVDGCRAEGGRWPSNLIHDGGEEVTKLLGDAARFFYCPKASKRDRGDGNNHPTVKPTDLMRYLCKLVTPSGGTVLDPFMGSGSTGKAARIAGFRFIGIELDPEYLEIARARIQHVEGI